MARMRQKEIVNFLADNLGMTKTQAKQFLDTFLRLAKEEVKKRGEFTVPGIGKLVKVERKPRIGRNPSTGERIRIPAKTTVIFRVGNPLKNALSLPGDSTIESPEDR